MRSGSIAFAGGAGLAAALLTTLPANAALLTLLVTDNGVLVGSASSSTGHLVFSSSADPEFSTIDITVSGVPLLPAPDLGTVSSDVSTSSGFTGTHILGIFVKQSGFGSFQVNPGTVTFTANGLIGAPGPTTESFLMNGASVASVTFPAAAGVALSWPDWPQRRWLTPQPRSACPRLAGKRGIGDRRRNHPAQRRRLSMAAPSCALSIVPSRTRPVAVRASATPLCAPCRS